MTEVPLKRVGRYAVRHVIGRGGAAAVYLAHQDDLDREVALKELAPLRAADEAFARRFVEESRLTGALAHANIVVVHEYFMDDGIPYIAMEYLPNGSLREYVDKLTLAQVAGVLEGVLAGLSYGQAMHIVHRDLKPENLLVSAEGRVKIADFGVARAIDQAAGARDVVTVTGTTIGTPAYMAPEQALSTELTPACDLYAVGMVAWELLTGRTPYQPTDSPAMILYRKVHEDMPRVSSVDPEVDPRLDDWVATMLAREPEDRYATAEAAWYALEDTILDLAGPRWRRDAAIVAAGEDVAAASDEPGRELTPADFTETAHGVAVAAGPRPGLAATIGPETADVAARPGPPDRPRGRRLAVIGGGGSAVVAAIVAAVVLLTSGGSSPPSHTSSSQTTPHAAAPSTWYGALWAKIDPPGHYSSQTAAADLHYVKACSNTTVTVHGQAGTRYCGPARVAVVIRGKREVISGGQCQVIPTGRLKGILLDVGFAALTRRIATSPQERSAVLQVESGQPSWDFYLGGKQNLLDLSGFPTQSFPMTGAARFRHPRNGVTAVAWECNGALRRSAA